MKSSKTLLAGILTATASQMVSAVPFIDGKNDKCLIFYNL